MRTFKRFPESHTLVGFLDFLKFLLYIDIAKYLRKCLLITSLFTECIIKFTHIFDSKESCYYSHINSICNFNN